MVRMLAVMALTLFSFLGMQAQNSLPAPGSGGSYNPAPIGGGMGPANGIGWNPGPPPPSSWGSGWGPSWNYPSSVIINTPSWANRGTVNVIACGYDASGVWQTIPLHVAYYYNGFDYDATVINYWSPWTQNWIRNIDQPAYNTTYYLRGNTYDFYVPLPIGTFYFNL